MPSLENMYAKCFCLFVYSTRLNPGPDPQTWRSASGKLGGKFVCTPERCTLRGEHTCMMPVQAKACMLNQ